MTPPRDTTARYDVAAPRQGRGRRVGPPEAGARTTGGHSTRSFRTLVRGHAFAADPPGTEELSTGDDVRVLREPGNPADPFATAVWATGAAPWRIGYLDRTVAVWLAPRLDAGARAGGMIDGWIAEPDGRWQRPVVLIEVELAPGGVLAAEQHPPLWGRPPGSTRRTLV